MKTKKKRRFIGIGIFVFLLMLGYVYLFAGAKNKHATNDVVKGDAGTKSLVVYFTRQGEIPGDMDAISAATPNSNKDMDGSDTEAAARMIQSLTGAKTGSKSG